MRSRASLLIVFMMLPMMSLAQETGILKGLKIRKSLLSISETAEAASLIYSKAKDSTHSSWAVNLGLGYDFDRERYVLTPYLEYHKNTLLDKKQDSREAGLAFRWDVSSVETHRWVPILLASGKYNEDQEKDNKSLRSSLSFSLKSGGMLSDGWKKVAPNQELDLFGKFFSLNYTPYLGLESENRISADKEEAKGHIYRWYFRINPVLGFLPGENAKGHYFELTVDYQYRRDFAKSVLEISAKEHEYFTASLNYNIFGAEDEKKVQIGFDYVKGEDPTQNFLSQSYHALSLKIKL